MFWERGASHLIQSVLDSLMSLDKSYDQIVCFILGLLELYMGLSCLIIHVLLELN